MLDRNPTNYFAEVEQIAFSPSHMVPGIEPSPDKMLQVLFYILCLCSKLPFHDGHSDALGHLLAEVRKYRQCVVGVLKRNISITLSRTFMYIFTCALLEVHSECIMGWWFMVVHMFSPWN